MYALVLVIGAFIDRIGRTFALELGLVVMALSTIGLLWAESVLATAVLLLGLGVGWNISFVAATAQLADRTSPSERGKLLGFNDLLSALLGAGLALLGGYALDAIGVAALAIGATVIVATPILLIARPTSAPQRGVLRPDARRTLLGRARRRRRADLLRGFSPAPRSRAFATTSPRLTSSLLPSRSSSDTRYTSPGYVFIAPKKRSSKPGRSSSTTAADSLVHADWTSRGVTDFRVQTYRGKPVLTWWRGRSEDRKRKGRYSIYDNRYRLITYVRPGNDIAGDMHEFSITKRNTALITLSNVMRVKHRKVLEGAFQEIDIKTGKVLFEWHSMGTVALVESYYRLPKDPRQDLRLLPHQLDRDRPRRPPARLRPQHACDLQDQSPDR